MYISSNPWGVSRQASSRKYVQYVKEIPSELDFLSVYRFQHPLFNYELCWPIPVAARSKAWVCRRWLAGNEGSNPAGDMDICLL